MKAQYAYENDFLSEGDWLDQLTIFTRIMNLPGGMAFRTRIEPFHEGTRAYDRIFDAYKSVFEYIEIFYNRVRRHSAIGMTSPVKYEEAYAQCA